jgi:hypothetical protein
MRPSPALAGPGFPDWDAVDAAIDDGAEAAFEFLERLVASPSTVGRELPASGSWPPNWTAWASRSAS